MEQSGGIRSGAAPALLEVTDICKGFGLGPWRQVVLEGCSFTPAPGKLTVLIGPSGCGKSTLIAVLAGYESIDAGEVLLLGKPVRGPGSDRLVVFQETALFPWMTTYKNVIYGPMVQRMRSRAEIRAAANHLLEIVGLKDFKDKYPNQLSGGMQRRAELARGPKRSYLQERGSIRAIGAGDRHGRVGRQRVTGLAVTQGGSQHEKW
jgi:NitT/TauT family transport system ATP-binding protein